MWLAPSLNVFNDNNIGLFLRDSKENCSCSLRLIGFAEFRLVLRIAESCRSLVWSGFSHLFCYYWFCLEIVFFDESRRGVVLFVWKLIKLSLGFLIDVIKDNHKGIFSSAEII